MADYLGALTLLPARRPCFSQMLGPSRLLPVDRVRNVDGPFLLGGNTSSLLLCRHLDWAFTVCCQAALASRSQLRFSLRLGVCLFSLSADRPLPKRLRCLSLGDNTSTFLFCSCSDRHPPSNTTGCSSSRLLDPFRAVSFLSFLSAPYSNSFPHLL